jgi:hypothetical protein
LSADLIVSGADKGMSVARLFNLVRATPKDTSLTAIRLSDIRSSGPISAVGGR